MTWQQKLWQRQEKNTTIAVEAQHKAEEEAQAKERRMQETLLSIKSKFGKNSILRGLNLEVGATAIERNKQIGGHNA